MKIAIPCSGQTLDDPMDSRFGRAPYFLVIEGDTPSATPIPNAALTASGGAGITAGQQLIDLGVTELIANQLGPNALLVFSDAGIEVRQGIPGSVRDNLDAYSQGRLEKLSTSGPAHADGGRHA